MKSKLGTDCALGITLALGLSSCMSLRPGSRVEGDVQHNVILECFPPGYSTPKGKPVSCETSAVELIGRQLLVLSDKETPDPVATQAFLLDIDSVRSELIPNSAVRYDRRPVLLAARKIEAMAASQDSAWEFATTDFDWPPDPASTEPDAYNVLLYWRTTQPDDVRIAYPTSNRGVVSSVSLRKRFASSLADSRFPGGPPYFKIEGLTTLPDDRLLFGVREVGTDYEHFSYAVALIETRFTLGSGALELDDTFRKAIWLDLAVPDDPSARLGLSSLLYDRERELLWMLTSVEGSEGQGQNSAYLWSLPIGDESTISQVLKPELLRNSEGAPLRLPFKAEGMTFLDRDTLLIAHDEDRSLSHVKLSNGTHTRTANESILSVVRLH